MARLQGRLLNAVEVVDVLNRTALGGLMRVEGIDVREPDRLVIIGKHPRAVVAYSAVSRD
jgi:hypothetical protein